MRNRGSYGRGAIAGRGLLQALRIGRSKPKHPEAVFLRRAAFVATTALGSALIGFATQAVLPAREVTEAEGMIRMVVSLEGTLLALVLGFLISTSHGLFSAQQHQWQTIGRAVLTLDRLLMELDAQDAVRRLKLYEVLVRIKGRFWAKPTGGRRTVDYDDLSMDAASLREVIAGVVASSDNERRALPTLEEAVSHIFETQLTMIHSLVNPMPALLFNSVVGWTCLLFFGYGLLVPFGVLTTFMALLGATSIASAAFLILELSDPYIGLFRMPTTGIDKLMTALATGTGRLDAPMESLSGVTASSGP